MTTTEPLPETIDVETLRAMMDEHQPVTVLDIRTVADRAEWAIPGSIHADAYDALSDGDPDALAAVDVPADRPVVTVCGAGKMSLVAAGQLRKRGYRATSLDGGMKAWSLAWNSAELSLPASEATLVQVRRTGKGCLSYLVASEGEVAVIDPSLDAGVYIQIAERRGWVIRHVLETHIHADHLMRSRDLAARTGATLHLPAQERVSFPYASLHDGACVCIGDVTLETHATPGHTPESMSYLLDGDALLTGDTLFLDGVGRPDLEASPDEARRRAHQLYQSLQRILALPPETLILPGHTNRPVEFDGRPLRATLGEVRERVGLLQVDEETFVTTLLDRLPATPPNHHRIVELNEAGEMPDGDPAELEAGANRCAIS